MEPMTGFVLIPVGIAGTLWAVYQYRAYQRRKLARSKRPIEVRIKPRDDAARPS